MTKGEPYLNLRVRKYEGTNKDRYALRMFGDWVDNPVRPAGART